MQSEFQKADESIRKTQSELNEVNKALKFNPDSIELNLQKQELLTEEIEETAGKLKLLKENQDKVKQAFADNPEWEKQYEPLSAKISQAQENLKKLAKEETNAEKAFNSGKLNQEQFDEVKARADAARKALRELQGQEEELEAKFANGHMTGEQYREYRREVEITEGKLKSLQAELDETKNAADGAEGDFKELADTMDDTAESTEGVSDGFTVMKGALADLAADGVRSLIDDLKELAAESQQASNNFAAATGATAEEMNEYSAQMEEVYKHNYGDSLTDVADAMAVIKQNAKDVDPKNIGELTERALMLKDTFGFEVNETMRAANMLIDQFGISGEQAFTLIAQGAQNGLGKNGDLLDSINEYAVHYRQLGYDSEEFFNSLSNGTAAGTFSVDKLGDAMKEFGIRVKDTADSTTEGFELIGLDADEMREAFAKGGDSAQEATEKTLNALFDMDDAVKRNQAGVDLFGTMWEDLGEDGVKALTDVSGQADMTANTLDKIAEVKYDDTASRLEEVGRTLKMEVLKPLVDDLLPAVEAGADWAADHIPEITALIKGIGITFVGMKLAGYIADVKDKVGELTSALQGGSGAAEAFSNSLKIDPYTAAFTIAIAGAEMLKTKIDAATEAIDETCDNYDSLTEEQKKFVDETEKGLQTIRDNAQARKDSADSAEEETGKIEALRDRLYELDDAETVDNASKAEMQAIVDELNQTMPDLNAELDEQTGHLKTSRTQINKSIESWKNLALAQAAQEKLVEIQKDLIDAQSDLTESEKRYNEELDKKNGLQEELESTAQRIIELQKKGDVSAEMETLQAKAAELKTALDESQSAVTELRDQYNASKSAVEDLGTELDETAELASTATEETNKTADAAEDAAGNYDDLTGSIEDTAEAAEDAVEKVTVKLGNSAMDITEEAMSDISEIANTYKEAVEDRAEDIESSLDLFEKFPEQAQVTMQDLFDALQSNQDAIADWSANIANLAERGISDGLLKELEEAGPQSANLVKALAESNEDELQSYSQMWEDTHKLIRDTSIGQLQDLETQSEDAVKRIVSSSIDALNANDPALQAQIAGINFSNGFLTGLQDGAGAIYQGVQTVADTAMGILNGTLRIASPSKRTRQTGLFFDEGLEGGIEDGSDSVYDEISALSNNAAKELQSGLSGSEEAVRAILSRISGSVADSGAEISPAVIEHSYAVKSPAQPAVQPTVAAPTYAGQTVQLNMIVDGKTIASVSAPYLDIINGANLKLASRGGAV